MAGARSGGLEAPTGSRSAELGQPPPFRARRPRGRRLAIRSARRLRSSGGPRRGPRGSSRRRRARRVGRRRGERGHAEHGQRDDQDRDQRIDRSPPWARRIEWWRTSAFPARRVAFTSSSLVDLSRPFGREAAPPRVGRLHVCSLRLHSMAGTPQTSYTLPGPSCTVGSDRVGCRPSVDRIAAHRAAVPPGQPRPASPGRPRRAAPRRTASRAGSRRPGSVARRSTPCTPT